MNIFKQILKLVYIHCILISAVYAQEGFEIKEIASGVFLHYGNQQQINPDNQGDIANIGFIVGDESVAVIDTGGSRPVGENLKNAIRNITDLPIRYVILTHAHPDHIFGVKAFESENSEIVGHRNLDNSLVQRGQFYRDRFISDGFKKQDLELLPQTVFVDGQMNLELGNRQIRLIAAQTSHTNNDLMVFDELTKTLWTGDILFRERVPVIDGNVTGWLSTIDQLAADDIDLIVPGHGPVAINFEDAFNPQQRYLEKLVKQVRKLLADQGSLQQAVETVGRDEEKIVVIVQ